MKLISAVLGLAFIIISAVMISLVQRGGALKPAGVIKAAEIGQDPEFIGKQIAIRLYPDFHAAESVVWYIEAATPELADIPRSVLDHYQNPNNKPTLVDLRGGHSGACSEKCWYVQELGQELPESIQQKTKGEATAEIYIQNFARDEKVPEACENEKLLTVACMRPISVREVRRKIKTSAPHYFMQRYQQSQFYLFVEKH